MEHTSRDQLLQCQQALQGEADQIFEELELNVILAPAGRPVRMRSAALGLMVGRDLDVTVICAALEIQAVAQIGRALAVHQGVRQVLFKNDTGHWNTSPGYPDGLSLGLRYRSRRAGRSCSSKDVRVNRPESGSRVRSDDVYTAVLDVVFVHRRARQVVGCQPYP